MADICEDNTCKNTYMNVFDFSWNVTDVSS